MYSLRGSVFAALMAAPIICSICVSSFGSKLRCLVASGSPYILARGPASSFVNSRSTTVLASSRVGYISRATPFLGSLTRQCRDGRAAVVLDFFLNIACYGRIWCGCRHCLVYVDHAPDNSVYPLRYRKL